MKDPGLRKAVIGALHGEKATLETQKKEIEDKLNKDINASAELQRQLAEVRVRITTETADKKDTENTLKLANDGISDLSRKN